MARYRTLITYVIIYFFAISTAIRGLIHFQGRTSQWLVTGLLAGYLIRERKKALISSFIGTFGGYMILFYMQSDSLLAYLLESEILQDIPADMIAPLFWTSVILAAIILSILGIIGVYIAHRMFVKSEEPKYQQSGVLE